MGHELSRRALKGLAGQSRSDFQYDNIASRMLIYGGPMVMAVIALLLLKMGSRW